MMFVPTALATPRTLNVARRATTRTRNASMDQATEARITLRGLIENWALWRDAGDWERFPHRLARRRPHDGDLVPGQRRRVHPRQQGRLGTWRLHPALPGRHHDRPRRRSRHRPDQDDQFRSAPMSMVCAATSCAPVASTISSSAAPAAGGSCCASPSTKKTASTRWIRLPRSFSIPQLLDGFPEGYRHLAILADADRLYRQAGHAWPHGARGRCAVCARQAVACGRHALGSSS